MNTLIAEKILFWFCKDNREKFLFHIWKSKCNWNSKREAKISLLFGNRRSSPSPWRTSWWLVRTSIKIVVATFDFSNVVTTIYQKIRNVSNDWQSPEGFPRMACEIYFFVRKNESVQNFATGFEHSVSQKSKIETEKDNCWEK